MVGEMIERCKTGILGYDVLCQGGFVRNSSNVIVGGPGSGKTTFLLEFLHNGITKFQENGLYCSFEPDIVDTLNDAFSHGWDFYKLAEEGKIKFVRFSPETSISELKNELTKLISQNDIKRICFDPVSVLALDISEGGKIRERIFDLVSLMKRLKVTSLLSDESMESENSLGESREGDWTKTDIIRFLCDSVSILYSSDLTGKSDRSIKIEKMRRTNHNRNFIGMKITDNGINILSKENPSKNNNENSNQNNYLNQNKDPSFEGNSALQQQPQEMLKNPVNPVTNRPPLSKENPTYS